MTKEQIALLNRCLKYAVGYSIQVTCSQEVVQDILTLTEWIDREQTAQRDEE